MCAYDENEYIVGCSTTWDEKPERTVKVKADNWWVAKIKGRALLNPSSVERVFIVSTSPNPERVEYMELLAECDKKRKAKKCIVEILNPLSRFDS